jgi:hypothetical protein
VRVLRQQARGDVVVLVLAVQEEQVPEGLRGIGRVGEQVGQLLEGRSGVFLAENNGLQK